MDNEGEKIAGDAISKGLENLGQFSGQDPKQSFVQKNNKNKSSGGSLSTKLEIENLKKRKEWTYEFVMSFRKKYRASMMPQNYSPFSQIFLVQIPLCAAVIGYSAWRLLNSSSSLTHFEKSMFVITFIFSNFVEYVFHRYVMHRPNLLYRVYK